MLQSQNIEHRTLRFLLGTGVLNWRPTTLPELSSQIGADWNNVVAALDRLHSQRVIELRKWKDGQGFVPYQGLGFDSEFFYRGDFQMRVTPMGQPYFQALELESQLNQPGVRQAMRHIEDANRALAQATPFAGFRSLASLQKQVEDVLRQTAPMRESFENSKLMAFSGEWEETFQTVHRLRQSLRLDELSRLAADASLPLAEMHRLLGAQLEPIMGLYKSVGRQIAEEINRQNLLLGSSVFSHQMEGVLTSFREQSTAIRKMTVALPMIAQTWPSDLLVRRLGLVENVVKNAAVWQEFRDHMLAERFVEDIRPPSLEKLNVAGQFVFNHGLFVRRLPPPLPSSDESRYEDEGRHRDEEVGARLEVELASLDQRLVELRRRAWENLRKGVAAARLAAAGAREVYTEVLHRLAPDDEVLKTDIWQKRDDRSVAKPTRRMRIEFIVGQEASDLDMLLQFDKSIAQANKFTHKFADNVEVVRVSMAQLENCTYLLLTYRKPKEN